MEDEVVEQELGNELDTTLEDTGQTVEETPEGEAGEDVGFSPAQLQQMKSSMGRLIKKQIEESVLPMLQQNVQQPHQQMAPDKMNEKLQERLFGGDIVGTVSEIMEMKEQARTNISQKNVSEVKKALTAYSEDPLYMDLAADAEKIAQGLVAEHYPPGPAAELAYLRAKDAYVKSALDNQETGGLNLLRGGKRKAFKKTPKIPAQFLAQAQKDIDSGVFKDLNEWVASVDARTRKSYGF